jgi:preprotein translocase subunit YajC
MRFRKFTSFALAATIAAAPAAFVPAAAASAQQVQPGMAVVDPSGGAVGNVTAVQGNTVLLKTDRHEVQLPLASFTAHEGKLLFAMTAEQLNAETEKLKAEAAAAVAPGAQVYGSDGTLAGTIESIDTELVTIKLASGEMVRLPRSGVGGSDKGAVLGVTTARLTELASEAGSAEQ